MARRTVDLDGILPAMVTPMVEGTGEVDEPALARLTDRLIKAGSGGLIPCGSTGEFSALSVAERRRVTEVVVEAAAGRVPVVPQTGALSTRETIEHSQHAEAVGASGVMIIPPFYEPLPWPVIVDYYRTVASSIRIPIVFYNLPTATGIRPTGEQIAELAAIEGIDWIKDSSGDAVSLTELIQRYGSRIGVMNGSDSLTLYGLLARTRAAVLGAANVIPDLCVALFDAAARRRDLNAACEIWTRMWPICNVLETSGSYVAAVKAGCDIIGESAGSPRSPILPLGDEAKARLRQVLETAWSAPMNS